MADIPAMESAAGAAGELLLSILDIFLVVSIAVVVYFVFFRNKNDLVDTGRLNCNCYERYRWVKLLMLG